MTNEYETDPAETAEWVDAIKSVIAFEGTGRADDILEHVVATARRAGANLPFAANTAYINTIPVTKQPAYPGDRKLENRVRAAIRWNAAAIVLKANKEFFGAWWSHRLVPVGGYPLRNGFYSLLARSPSRARR